MALITEFRYDEERAEALRVQNLMLAPAAGSGLKFFHIPPQFTEIVVWKEKSSQLGVLVMLRDTRNGHINVIHYTSIKSKRVCKSVLAALCARRWVRCWLRGARFGPLYLREGRHSTVYLYGESYFV